METSEKIDIYLEHYVKTSFGLCDFVLTRNGDVDEAFILDHAQGVLDGYSYYGGRDKIHIGMENIDWHGGQMQHQEWRAQLNRLFMIDYLRQAHAIDPDEKYPLRAKQLIKDWMRFIEKNPGGRLGTHEKDNSLNLSIRVGHSRMTGLMGCLASFAKTDAFDDDFVESVFDSIEQQLNDLIKAGLNASGNWRVSQLDAIIMVGLRCPFMSSASFFLDYAVKRMKNTLLYQFLSDGAHMEMTPNYHFWMSKVFVFYYQLGHAYPDLNVVTDREKVIKALRLNVYFEQFPLNDSHFDYLNKSRREGQLREVNTWLKALGEQEVSFPLPDLTCEAAGYVYSSDEENDVVFDVSKYGGSHTHSSRLQLCLNRKGKALLLDPGALSYEMSNPLAPYGKSTMAHSTISINGYNQCPSDARLILSHSNDGFAYGEGVFDGSYCSGRNLWEFSEGIGHTIWARQYRSVLHVKGEYVIVIDAVHSLPDTKILNNWAMAPFEDVQLNKQDLSVTAKDADESNLFMKMMVPPEGAVEPRLSFGQEGEDMRGFAVAATKGGVVPHPHLSFECEGGLPAGGISVMVIAPFDGPENPWTMKTVEVNNMGSLIHFRYEPKPGLIDSISWFPNLHGALDQSDEDSSDGSFVFTRKSAEGERIVAYSPNGSHVEGFTSC